MPNDEISEADMGVAPGRLHWAESVLEANYDWEDTGDPVVDRNIFRGVAGKITRASATLYEDGLIRNEGYSAEAARAAADARVQNVMREIMANYDSASGMQM